MPKKTIIVAALTAYFAYSIRVFLNNVRLVAPEYDRSTIRKAYWRTAGRNWTGRNKTPIIGMASIYDQIIEEAELIQPTK